jgi:hypothetical protein
MIASDHRQRDGKTDSRECSKDVAGIVVSHRRDLLAGKGQLPDGHDNAAGSFWIT